jgi:hypothetical protein
MRMKEKINGFGLIYLGLFFSLLAYGRDSQI